MLMSYGVSREYMIGKLLDWHPTWKEEWLERLPIRKLIAIYRYDQQKVIAAVMKGPGLSIYAPPDKPAEAPNFYQNLLLD